MRILLTGATGIVGLKLSRVLKDQGHELVILTRDAERARSKVSIDCEYFDWQSESESPPAAAIRDIDVVINLAGESIAEKRWTDRQKEKIRTSRILTTRNLVNALNRNQNS